MTNANKLITGIMYGPILAAFAIGTVAANEPTAYEMPLAPPCEHVIMMSAPDEGDGGVLAYCAGAQFFVYDQQDGQWYRMDYADLRGVGDCVPMRESLIPATERHFEVIGDQRAVGLYE